LNVTEIWINTCCGPGPKSSKIEPNVQVISMHMKISSTFIKVSEKKKKNKTPTIQALVHEINTYTVPKYIATKSSKINPYT